MSNMIVTTSWDDGHMQIKKLADLLMQYGIKGTFYIPRSGGGYNQPESDIKNLAKNHEVGSHTLTHPILTSLGLERVKNEIVGSKKWLDNLLGVETKMFCSPRGFYNDQIKDIIKDAGYIGARTVGVFNNRLPQDRFAWDPTLHIYPFPFRRRSFEKLHLSRHLFDPFWHHLPILLGWRLPVQAYVNWLELAKATFDYSKKHGQIWHLWGHCFELEKYDMWRDLEKLFQHISLQDGVEHLTNSEALERI